MEILTYTVTPEEDGVCVRHILKAKLHFSTHAVARLTRAENGIRVNGIHEGFNLLDKVLQLSILHFSGEGKRNTAGGFPMEVKEKTAIYILYRNSPAKQGCNAEYIFISHKT